MLSAPAAPRASLPALLLGGLLLGGLLLPATAGADAVVPSTTCRGLFLVPVHFAKPDETILLVLDTGAWPTVVDPDALVRVTGRRVAAGRRFDVVVTPATLVP